MKPKKKFVVEIKKSRRLGRNLTKRSIWGELDLSELARETPDVVETQPVPEPESTQNRNSGSNATETQSYAGSPALEPMQPEAAIMDRVADQPDGVVARATDGLRPDKPVLVRANRSNRRRRRAKLMPPGQRWKLKLPKILRKPS